MDNAVRGSGFSWAEGSARKSPPGETGVVSRPRLISALDADFDHPGSFVMVSAPAGYGKTYLLSEWAELNRARGRATAWHRVTADDGDPVVLWSSLLGAIERGLSECGTNPAARELAVRLRALKPGMPAPIHAAFVAAFGTVLRQCGLPIVLVVDDAHLLDGTAAETEFIAVIQALPSNVLLAFATRSPPQMQAARVDGRLRELTADSLSFTRAEETELFALRGFEDADLGPLHGMAGGWPAVLSLALLDVERGEPGKTITGNWTDPSILYDYLEHEIFAELPSDVRDVLLTLGISATMTADLANAIRETADSAEVLRALATHNQIVRRVSTDAAGRTWYDVKPPFGQFLREKIRESHPDTLRAMITRAAEWFTEFGDAFAALELALDPPNSELVDRILRRRGYGMIADGHAPRILAMLPPSNGPALTGPFARLMTAYAAACIPRPERAADLLTSVHLSDLTADELMEWDWLRYLVNAQLAFVSGKPLGTVQQNWPENSLAKMPEALRLAIGITRGFSNVRAGTTDAALHDLTVAFAVAENADDLSNMVRGTVGLAAAAAARCDFSAALDLSTRALHLASRSTTQNQAGSRTAACCIASWSSLELLDIPGARTHANDAVESAARDGDAQQRLKANDAYNNAYFDSLPQRRRVAQEFTTTWPPPYLEGMSDTYVVASMYSALRMTFEIDERRWSDHVLDRARLFLGEGADWQAAYALHLLRTGRDESARPIVATLLSRSDRFAVALSEIVVLSLQAVLETRSNNQYRAHSALYRALELADRTGAYRRVRIADRATIVRLILAGAGRFGAHEHIARALLSEDSAASVSHLGALTEREREILGELTTLRTVEEISHDLLLSVNTVKTHMRGIYRKLAVTSRRQAVGEAERLGLL